MDTAALVRIFDANPTDEIVDKRGRAITALRDKLRATTKVASLLGHANCIGIAFSSGAMPEPLATEVEAAIRAESSAFVREGQDLQMLVCAIGASILLVEEQRPNGWGTHEIFCAALLSSFSHLGPHTNGKLESLRQGFVISAREMLERAADFSRKRASVPLFEVPGPVEDEEIEKYAEKLGQAANKSLKPLLANAALDREELDYLWWALSDWSNVLNRRVSTLDTGAAIVASSIEVVDKLKRFPAAAHAYIALRHVKAEKIDAAALSESLSVHRTELWNNLGDLSQLASYSSVFPILAWLTNASAIANAPSESMHWCRSLTLELFLLFRLQNRIGA